MANYKLSELAKLDLDEITGYTALNFGAEQALAYPHQIHRGAGLAANFPSMGRPYTTKKGRVYQQYNVGRHALFYRPTEEGIFIVRVLHLMMDFDRHLDG